MAQAVQGSETYRQRGSLGYIGDPHARFGHNAWKKLDDTIPAFYIFIRPFFSNHGFAANRRANGVITCFAARVAISAGRSLLQ